VHTPDLATVPKVTDDFYMTHKGRYIQITTEKIKKGSMSEMTFTQPT